MVLQNAINFIASVNFSSFTATKRALAAHNEMYHFQRAVQEHGETAVVQETAAVLQERYKCTYAEAAADAGHRVRSMLELLEGEDTFKTVRNNLKNT